MRQRARVLMATLAVVATAVLGIVSAGTSSAAGGPPVFTVMNTSETLPDGVWFRNSPHTADTDRVTGHGVYKNEQVQLECYAWGDAVPPYGNRLWYFVLNMTRPTNAGVTNRGYLNAHYINDGKPANQRDGGVPECRGAVYYSPFEHNQFYPTKAINPQFLGVSAWTSGSACDAAKAYRVTNRSANGLPVTMLAGWSLGRVGPIYYLYAANVYDEQRINYILMIDPGNYSDLHGSILHPTCDSKLGAGAVLAGWLTANRSARLVILAGDSTTFPKQLINKRASAGIQNVYFNAIRAADSQYGEGIRSRVLVCNYSMPKIDLDSTTSLKQSHDQMFKSANQYIGQQPITTCPALDGMNQGASWHP